MVSSLLPRPRDGSSAPGLKARLTFGTLQAFLDAMLGFEHPGKFLMFLIFGEGQGCDYRHLLLAPGGGHVVTFSEHPFGLRGIYASAYVSQTLLHSKFIMRRELFAVELAKGGSEIDQRCAVAGLPWVARSSSRCRSIAVSRDRKAFSSRGRSGPGRVLVRRSWR